MCMGGVERSVAGYKKLEKHLNDRHYKSLEIESIVLENIGHSGTKGAGFERGLQFVFKRPSLKLSSAVLKKYTGSYKLGNGRSLELKEEAGMLVSYLDGNRLDVMHAASENDFYSTAEFINVHFKKDEKGNVSGFQLDTYGSSQFIIKTK